jgi:hypothetical protein
MAESNFGVRTVETISFARNIVSLPIILVFNLLFSKYPIMCKLFFFIKKNHTSAISFWLNETQCQIDIFIAYNTFSWVVIVQLHYISSTLKALVSFWVVIDQKHYFYFLSVYYKVLSFGFSSDSQYCELGKIVFVLNLYSYSATSQDSRIYWLDITGGSSTVDTSYKFNIIYLVENLVAIN